MIYNNILETIGNTPVVRLNRMAPEHRFPTAVEDASWGQLKSWVFGDLGQR